MKGKESVSARKIIIKRLMSDETVLCVTEYDHVNAVAIMVTV
jgi:hypothetical protein